MSNTETDISKEAVERYEAYGHRGDAVMCKEAEGSWVDYDDYVAQAARIEQLEEALATARNDALKEVVELTRNGADHYLSLSKVQYAKGIGYYKCNEWVWRQMKELEKQITALMTKDTQ